MMRQATAAITALLALSAIHTSAAEPLSRLGQEMASAAQHRPSCTNSEFTMEQYLEQEKDYRNLTKELFSQVPRGLTITNEQANYVAPNGANVKLLPLGDGPPKFGMRGRYVFYSPCRVHDDKGQEWIAYSGYNGGLGYVSAAEVQRATPSDLADPPKTDEPVEHLPTILSEFRLGNTTYNLVTFHDPSLGVPWFNSTLKKQSNQGEVRSCSLLIDVPVGVADGNHSYGAYCVLHKDNQDAPVEVCKDKMVGHFKLNNLDSGEHTKEALAAFVASNCFGG